ncbi:hypothetical protein LCGC14_2290710, partial [marine sediment metagenome]
DDDIRELVAEFATGLGESIYWPGSAASQGASTASSGEMLPGGARVPGVNVVDTALFDTLDGELTAVYWKGTTQARPTLLHGGSTSSFVVGGALAIEASPASEATTPFTSHWVAVDSTATFLISSTEGDNSFATAVSFGTTFGAVPNVQATMGAFAHFGTGDSMIFGIDNITTSGCSSYMSFIGAAANPNLVATMTLRSEGTVTL